jgi:hypothetical protein
LNSQNFSRFRNSDQVPTQDFQKSIGGKTGGGAIRLTHESVADISAGVAQRQVEAARGPVLENVVDLRTALRRKSTVLKPWSTPNGSTKGGNP